MGNTLLDFVMGLVRDPDAAARYAADPAGAIAGAQLTGVTIADVQNLIPVVTDSMAMATPGFGGIVDAANVWTSGAAAAAFDAFDVPHTDAGTSVLVSQHVDMPAVQESAEHVIDDGFAAMPTSMVPEPLHIDSPQVDEPDTAVGWTQDAEWHHSQDGLSVDHHVVDPGFDLF